MEQQEQKILFQVECIVEPSMIALKRSVTVGKSYPVIAEVMAAYIIIDDDNEQAMYVSSYFRKIEPPISYLPEQVSERKSYFNTTDLPEVDVKKLKSHNSKQNKIILEYMERNHWEEMTSLDILFNGVLNENVPETSIRRSLCYLLQDGKITRTGWKEGQYGRRIGVYKAVNQPMPEIFF